MTLTPIPLDDLPPTELLPHRTDTDSWVTVVRDVSTLAQQIAGTEFVPRGLRNSVPATAAAILYGREVGLPPMTALSQIHVVEGRPGLSAEGMRALVLAAGHEIAFDEVTSAICRIRGRRLRSSEWTPLTWTIDDARRAGLLRKGSAWESYPRDMLIARATTALCRMVFPDVIHGFRSVEELDDMGAAPSGAIASPSSKRTSTVSRRRKASSTTAEPEGDGPTTDNGSAPPPPRVPSLPGEAEVSVETPTVSEPAGQTDGPVLVNAVTRKLLFGQLRRLGLGDDEQGRPARLDLVARIAGRDRLDSANDLTQEEASAVTTVLSTMRDGEALDLFLAGIATSEIATPIEDDQLPIEEDEEP